MNMLEYENYHENIIHGDLVFPYNTYICTIPLDFPNVPLHWHDEMELIYVKKGKGKITVDLEVHPVEAPALALILPGQPHAIDQMEGYSMEYENIIFHPNMLLSKRTDITSTGFLTPLMDREITVPAIFSPDNTYYRELIAPIDACDEIGKTQPKGYELFIKSQLYQFFFVLDNHYRNVGSRKENQKKLDKMKIVLKYIENHYQERITIADVADAVGFSESHFMRYFKSVMGTSFVDYLRDFRLTMASRLLRSSEDTILDIASEAGFENLSYFNRAFKQKYHTTPSRFRRENQNR